jgi:D-glycero-D-manno-heptose 1,7-bisphosphate phosphatase
LKEANSRVIVVTNQAGIARGMMTEADLLDIHRRMAADVQRAGGGLDAVYYCPHHWDEGCSCRKPKPGMLYEAQHAFNLNLHRTPFIGDDERDAQAAAEAGCPWIPVTPGRPLLSIVRELVDSRAAV